MSLYEYVRLAWPIVEPSNPFISGWHIHAICEHLEACTRGEIRNLIINIPPRHMKSLCVSVFWPTWEWTFQPWTRWIYASYAQSLSIRDSLKCRRIIESDWYRENFGHVYRLTSDQNQKMRFDNSRTGYRIATSVGGSSTGEGGDRLICDDPHKLEDAHSKPERLRALSWWDEVMTSRYNNISTVVKVIIMQRIHKNDLTGHLLEKMKSSGSQYEFLCLPAEYRPARELAPTRLGFKDPRREFGELLWPEMYSAEQLAEVKGNLGSWAASAQLQQEPSEEEGGIIKRADWRFWQPPGTDLPPVTVQLSDGTLHECPVIDLPEDLTGHLQSWDCAFKDAASNSFVVGQVWARKSADRFLLDQRRGHFDLPHTIKAIKRLSRKWPQARRKLIEDKANGPAVIQSLRKHLGGLIPVNPKGNKEARLAAVAPDVESGNIYLPHPLIYPWVSGLIDEIADFPFATHDDQADALSQANNWMNANSSWGR